MTGNCKKLTDFLLQLGTEEISHSGMNYLAHCIGVYRDLHWKQRA